MDKYCLSCSIPLMDEFKGPTEGYCCYCTDNSGQLKPRRVIQQGIAEWLKSWQPDLDDQRAWQRAGWFMKAMPAWADD